MGDKEVSTVKKITQELIGGWFLYGILFGIIYSVLYYLITRNMEYSMNLMIERAVIAIILQGITIFLIWKFSTKSVFKKRTIHYDDVSRVMKNLVIFTIIICIINCFYNFYQVNSQINDISSQYNSYANRLSRSYDDEQEQRFNIQKEDAINSFQDSIDNAMSEAKKILNTYLIIVSIGLTIVYLAILPLVKKEILKYVD